ncbi:MAG: OmpH family outer membrane protein [Candidatus Omnitrophica bacterium]|nr:OmpH family outer membrane protein [Candidatus Omnitrophota bacterium]
MRRLGLVLLGGLIGLVLSVGVSFAAEKIAYVDLGRIFSEYGKTKSYDKVLTDKEKVYTDEREKQASEVKSIQDKYNLLSDKEKEAKKGELENKVKALQEFDRQRQTDLRKEQDERMKEIMKDIEEAVRQYSVKEGYSLVFNERVLIYQAQNLDITDKIVAILNKTAPKK